MQTWGGLTNTDAPFPAAQPTWPGSLVSGRSVRYAAGVLLVAAGYYAAAQGGQALLLTGPAGAFWAATGVGIAVLYLGGWRWWPGVLLGDLLTREFTLPLWAVLAETAGNLARALLAVVILRRLVGRRAAMDQLPQVGAVFVAVAVGEAVSATVAMLARQAGGLIDVSEMGVFWRSWWLGGLAGGLVVVPLALAWAHPRASAWRGRRAAEAALTLAAVIGLSVIAFSADQPFTYIMFPAFIWAALRFGPQGATLAVAVGAVIAVLATSLEVGPFVQHSPTDSALNLQLYIVFAALTTCCLAAIVSERRRAALELAESQRREGERAALERQRIARDLHDSVSQSLFSTTLHVRTAQRALELEQLHANGPVGEELGEIGQLTRGALAEMRALILELRPGALAEEGLVAALAKQASALSAREGLVIEVDGPDADLPLGPEVEEQLYRLGQEALANVVKHARASSATVRIAATDDIVTIEVTDDGRGFDPAAVGPEHFGLRSMRGRAADLGGRLEVTSAPGGGTVLGVQVPARR
ncbi:MAG TPA: MASE1 domain-containing protein [Actinomycetota bacterium]|nr:MASE1 domain-containing protein [Actinomycetota bacterium]